MPALSFSAASSRQIERLIDRYTGRFPQAIARALNRAGTSTRAVMARAISKDTALPVTAVKDKLRLEKATATKHVVRITVSGKRIPLIAFRARDTRSASGRGRSRGRGVTYNLGPGGGGRGRIPNAFITTVRRAGDAGGMHSGHEGVFVRVGSRRLPIKQRYGPSLPRVFEKVTPEGLAAGEASLIKNLQSELRFASSGGATSL